MFDWLQNIDEKLQEWIPLGEWIQEGADFVLNLSFIEQFLGAFFVVIIGILGVFSLIKKLAKLMIVVAVLFVIWLLWQNGVFG